jgi:hypothetical protein
MYFVVPVSDGTRQSEPTQLMPVLFGLTVGVPVLSVTAISTWLPSQMGIRWAVVPRDPGSTTFPVMTFTTFWLLDAL